VQRDTWEAEARQSKAAISELVAANARLQVSCPHKRCALNASLKCAARSQSPFATAALLAVL
jgi:hypothetical protein